MSLQEIEIAGAYPPRLALHILSRNVEDKQWKPVKDGNYARPSHVFHPPWNAIFVAECSVLGLVWLAICGRSTNTDRTTEMQEENECSDTSIG